MRLKLSKLNFAFLQPTHNMVRLHRDHKRQQVDNGPNAFDALEKVLPDYESLSNAPFYQPSFP